MCKIRAHTDLFMNQPVQKSHSVSKYACLMLTKANRMKQSRMPFVNFVKDIAGTKIITNNIAAGFITGEAYNG